MKDLTANPQRVAGKRPPLLLVVGWCLATLAIWAAVNSQAGRLVWWW